MADKIITEEITSNTFTVPDITAFHLPTYHEIPNVGLYLKQVVKLINDCLEPFFRISVTETMLSNYVKKHIISSPVKKQYDRDQIASLFFIVLAKTVLSLDNIQTILQMQQETYSTETAYEYFCTEFENMLLFVYGHKDQLEQVGEKNSKEKNLLRNVIVTIAHKFYLDHIFYELHLVV